MLYYDRTNLSKGTDIDKNNNSKECIVCYDWFFNHGFKFQSFVCNSCHDSMMLCLNLSDIATITVKSVDYLIFYGITNLKQLIY